MDSKNKTLNEKHPSSHTNGDVDPESLESIGDRVEDEDSSVIDVEFKLRRQLKDRHIAMISLGGVIGTGLFLGTATALKDGGPVGLILGYTTMGTICYSVMISLGEMVAYLPITGGHIKLAERFVDPALSFTLGWGSWYNWTIIMPAELTAAAVLIGFWSDVNPAVWITITMAVTISINMLGVHVYGEAEFIFASIKIITIVGLIILGIVLDLGGGPNHDRIGFRYWKDPGAFSQFSGIPGAKGRFLAWWSSMIQAAFSFIGTEVVALAAGETRNPRRVIPKAIRRVYIRIILFYVGGVIIIGLLVPYTAKGLDLTDGTAASSPFVIAMQNAGIRTLPSILNACLLTSAWSAASGDLYTSSRALYGLAVSGNAPRIFLKTWKNGLPYVSVIFCASFALLAYMGVSQGAGQVFGWFVNICAITGLLSWSGICVTYIRFYQGMKVQGYDRKKLPYASKLQPYAAWYAMLCCILICFTSGWKVFLKGQWATDAFVTNYLSLIIFPTLYIGAKLVTKKPIVKPEEMDFVTNIAEIEADNHIETPRNRIEALWQWLM